jgi:hypothetical protein
LPGGDRREVLRRFYLNNQDAIDNHVQPLRAELLLLVEDTDRGQEVPHQFDARGIISWLSNVLGESTAGSRWPGYRSGLSA